MQSNAVLLMRCNISRWKSRLTGIQPACMGSHGMALVEVLINAFSVFKPWTTVMDQVYTSTGYLDIFTRRWCGFLNSLFAIITKVCGLIAQDYSSNVQWLPVRSDPAYLSGRSPKSFLESLC